MIHINNIAITSIRLGLNLVQKIYSGSVLIYNASSTTEVVQNDQSYTYENLGKTYSWF